MATAPRRTHGMDNLLNQINKRFPNRDKTSDGWIGDAAHQAEVSGHNPDDTPGVAAEWNGDADSTPEVRAIDVDSDLRDSDGGVTAQQLVDWIRARPGVSAALRYIIYNRKIYDSTSGWVAQAYTGASAHTEHIHFSGAYSQAGDESTFDYDLDQLGDDDMSVADAETGTADFWWAADRYANRGTDTTYDKASAADQAKYRQSYQIVESVVGAIVAERLAPVTAQLEAIAAALSVPASSHS